MWTIVARLVAPTVKPGRLNTQPAFEFWNRNSRRRRTRPALLRAGPKDLSISAGAKIGTSMSVVSKLLRRLNMDTSETISDRFLRQEELVPIDRLSAHRATVIGVG